MEKRVRRREEAQEEEAEEEKLSKKRKNQNATHHASLGQVTTVPVLGSTVLPGGTRHDVPSLEKVVPCGQRQVPAWHVDPPRHVAPQAPHEELEVRRLVQLPEQHAMAGSALQAVEQEPQC